MRSESANLKKDGDRPPSPAQDELAQAGRSMLEEALRPVAADVQSLQQELTQLLPTTTASARDVVDHVFKSGGKRIRPALYFFCARLFNYRGEHLFPIAAVTEYVHTASLLHDDVIDSSSLRRNKPTANSLWGDQASVLVGDLIYARASELMAATGSLDIVATFAEAIRLMSEGELVQLEQCFDLDTPLTTYFRIIEYKTAVLIAASCRAAGILGGASQQECDALASFGASVGKGFQLVDDALDYLGEREVFGKPTNSDLKEGKVTLPILLLKDHASEPELAKLRGYLSKDSIADDELGFVLSLVEKYGTALQTIALARQHTDTAIAALDIFPASDDRGHLESLARHMVGRFN